MRRTPWHLDTREHRSGVRVYSTQDRSKWPTSRQHVDVRRRLHGHAALPCMIPGVSWVVRTVDCIVPGQRTNAADDPTIAISALMHAAVHAEHCRSGRALHEACCGSSWTQPGQPCRSSARPPAARLERPGRDHQDTSKSRTSRRDCAEPPRTPAEAPDAGARRRRRSPPARDPTGAPAPPRRAAAHARPRRARSH